MSMRHTSSIPPAPPRSSIPASLLMPMGESIAGRKSDAPPLTCIAGGKNAAPVGEGAAGKNSQAVTLHCGRKHIMGRYSVMYFGVLDGEAMLDVRRDGSFMGDIHVREGGSGHVNVPMEGQKIVVDVISADTREAQVTISIKSA